MNLNKESIYFNLFGIFTYTVDFIHKYSLDTRIWKLENFPGGCIDPKCC